MFSIDKLQFVDFNNLYVIAVGLTMAYIVVEANKATKASFFSILSSITTFVKEKALVIPNKAKEGEEGVITKIKYCINSGLLQERTIGSLSNTNTRAEKELRKIKEYEDYVERKLKFHTKTDFLNVISCDCFLYGLFILFVGAFEKKCSVHLNGIIVILLITMALLLIHCLWFERLELKSWIRHFKPNILVHVILLITGLVIGYNLNNLAIFSKCSCGALAVLSVLACFIGFIAYLLAVVLSNLILSAIILVKACPFWFSTVVEDHKEEIERHREELDRIEKSQSEIKMAENLSIKNKE